MKKGDIVTCINGRINGSSLPNKEITVGKNYTVIKESTLFINIITDNGYNIALAKRRFVLNKEETRNKIINNILDESR